jgi:predicted AAA+ superfamily ATPase
MNSAHAPSDALLCDSLWWASTVPKMKRLLAEVVQYLAKSNNLCYDTCKHTNNQQEHCVIARPRFLDDLIRFRDKHLIKVVTGIRRSGKSTLLELYQSYLIADGVSARQIVSVNLEDGECADIETGGQLFSHVSERLRPGRRMYVFLDEVQRVAEFQKVVDSLFILENCDVYITGSNA